MSIQPGRLDGEEQWTHRFLRAQVDRVRYPDGSEGEQVVIRHPGAAAVLPVLSALDGPDPQVLLIKQYRYAADGYLWEIPAGRLEEGEAPEACARRELTEETGCSCERLVPLTSIWTAPGFTDERIHLFAAFGLTQGASAREADEFLELHALPMSRVLEMVRDREITDAKTISAVLYVAGFESVLSG